MDEQQGTTGPAQGGPIAPPPMPGYPEPQPDQQAAIKLMELHGRIKSGGGWFYWIAGLSLINTLVVLFHGKFSFVAGLGITQIIDGLVAELGPVAAIIGLPINLIIAGIYVVFGYFACRRASWAFITGIVLYALDTVLFLIFFDIIPLAFHAFALFGIVAGLKAHNAALKIETQQAQAAPTIPGGQY